MNSLTVDSDWEAEPFDFLINGELVRMPLEEFLLVKGISAVSFCLYLCTKVLFFFVSVSSNFIMQKFGSSIVSCPFFGCRYVVPSFVQQCYMLNCTKQIVDLKLEVIRVSLELWSCA